jgi:hypothetical protein
VTYFGIGLSVIGCGLSCGMHFDVKSWHYSFFMALFIFHVNGSVNEALVLLKLPSF